MDRRITIALLVVLAVLGGYIWYTNSREEVSPNATITPAPTPVAVFNFDAGQVTALQVQEMKTNQTTRVVKNGGAWRMEQPKRGDAFETPIESILFDLAALNAERKIETPGDLAAFGLNPPAYQAQLTMQDGSTHTLALGNQNPDKNYFYALKDSDAAVYLIDASIGQALQDFVTSPPYTPTPATTAEPETTPTP